MDPCGHLSEAEHHWYSAPSQCFCHSLSTPILISWLSRCFSTLIQSQLLKPWTRSCHFHLQNPSRTPTAYHIYLNAYPWMFCATFFPSFFSHSLSLHLCSRCPEHHASPVLCLDSCLRPDHPPSWFPPYPSRISLGAEVLEMVFPSLTLEPIIPFSVVSTDSC